MIDSIWLEEGWDGLSAVLRIRTNLLFYYLGTGMPGFPGPAPNSQATRGKTTVTQIHSVPRQSQPSATHVIWQVGWRLPRELHLYKAGIQHSEGLPPTTAEGLLSEG